MSANDSGLSFKLKISSFLLLLESILVLALGLYMVALGFTHDKAWMPYLSVIGFAFVGSASLYALSRGINKSRRWANSPAILANLIALGVAKYQFEAGLYFLAATLAVMAITIIWILIIDISKKR